MALIVFSCRVTGPFMMFEETAKEIFKTLGRSWRTQGAFAADELPGLLEKLNDAERKDKERLAAIAAERERKLRASSYDEELRILEEEKQKAKEEREKVNFYQRIVPLQNMMKRAIQKEEPIMWDLA